MTLHCTCRSTLVIEFYIEISCQWLEMYILYSMYEPCKIKKCILRNKSQESLESPTYEFRDPFRWWNIDLFAEYFADVAVRFYGHFSLHTVWTNFRCSISLKTNYKFHDETAMEFRNFFFSSKEGESREEIVFIQFWKIFILFLLKSDCFRNTNNMFKEFCIFLKIMSWNWLKKSFIVVQTKFNNSIPSFELEMINYELLCMLLHAYAWSQEFGFHRNICGRLNRHFPKQTNCMGVVHKWESVFLLLPVTVKLTKKLFGELILNWRKSLEYFTTS